MKIAQSDLKKIYRDYLREQVPRSSDHCVEEGHWPDFFGGRLSRSSRGKLIDHITSCAACAREFELFLEMERAKNALAAEIGNLVRSGQEPPGPAIDRRPSRRFHFRWEYGLAFSGIAILALVLALSLVRRPGIPAIPDVTRGNQPAEIELQRPLDESTRTQGLEFRWKSRDSYESFVIEIFDDSLRRIWQSPPLTQSRLFIPKEIFDPLENGKTYYWMVTGTLRMDNKMESKLGAFKLKK